MLLSLYISRFFLTYLFLTLFVVFLIVFMIDTVELLRRAASVDNVSSWKVLLLALLHMPLLIETVLPFTIIMGGVFAFLRLNKTLTLAICRASGFSIWQILLPMSIIASIIGILICIGFSVLTASSMSLYQSLEVEYLGVNRSTESAINFTQPLPNNTGRLVILANASNIENKALLGVSIFEFNEKDVYQHRIETTSAILSNGNWQLQPGSIHYATGRVENFTSKIIPSSLSLEELETRIAQPMLLSFWQLPDSISKAKKIGVNYKPFEMRYYAYLVTPIQFIALIALSALFSLNMSRGGPKGKALIAAVGTAFFVFIAIDLIYDLGSAGWLPTWLAAILPIIVIFSVSYTRLLYTEDG